MKLSEAINLGMISIKFDPWIFYDVSGKDNECVGCLLGAAWLAANGKKLKDYREIAEQWPWINQEFVIPRPLVPKSACSGNTALALDIISGLAFGIKAGTTTLEQAVDWIRSVEPEEPKTEAELNAEWKQELVEMST